MSLGHEHLHPCPLCETPLTQDDDTEWLSCTTAQCRVHSCHCNGTVRDAAVTYTTLAEYIADTYPEQTVASVVAAVHDGRLNDDELTHLVTLLTKRDTDNMRQAAATNERVLEMQSGTFVPWTQVVHYTVRHSPDESDLIIAQVPLPDATTYTSDETEPFVSAFDTLLSSPTNGPGKEP